MKTSSLVDKLEVWGFEEGLTIFKDESIGFGFEIQPYDISCDADSEVNLKRKSLKDLLLSLPVGIDLQVIQMVGKSEEEHIIEHAKGANDKSLVGKMASERVARFTRLNDCGHLPAHKHFILARLKGARFSGQDAIVERRFSFFRKPQATLVEFSRKLELAKRTLFDIERNLQVAGLKPVLIATRQTVELIFGNWNPNHPLGLGAFDETDIRDRVLLSPLVKYVNGFRLGSTYHRVVTLKCLPEETFAGMASALSDLPFSSVTYLSVHVPNQEKEIEWLKLNRRMAYAMVVGKKGVSDLESEAKLRDLEQILSEVVSDGERILKASLSIILKSENEAELDEQLSHVLQTIRALSGAEGFMETYAAFDSFAESSIPNARNPERAQRMKLSNVADLLPIYGTWKGFRRPLILLRSRSGSLFKFDPFAAELANANQIISGGSGAGKSYLANLMTGQMLLQKPRVFIIDVGGSYQKTCELLNGQYVPLSLNSGISINPFDRAESDDFVADEKIKFLVGLIQTMTKEHDAKGVGRLEKTEIEHAVLRIYKSTQKPRMADLKEELLRSETPEVQRIGKILGAWCGDTPFGKFVDQPTNIEFKKDIICFDLKGLRANPDLQAAALFIITDLIWREVQRDRTEMKISIFDECWQLFESEAGSQLVGEVFRTFRKYYASAIAISQNIDDFAKGQAAQAIMPTSSIRWILKQPGADFNRLATVLNLNEQETALIQSLTQVKGEFSEAFLICENHKAVVSMESTPFEYWLATTDPRDFTIFKDEEAATQFTGQRLIEHLAQKFPKGAGSI